MSNLIEKTPLYRIIDLEGLLSILYFKTERYVWPFSWEDTFEGCGLRYVLDREKYRQFIRVLFSQYENDNDTADSVLYNFAKASTISRSFYGQCWSTNSDSDALWRIYSYGNCAIQIESDKERIERYIDIIDYSPSTKLVEYDVSSEDVDSSFNNYYERHVKFDKQFFHKREAFRHENEVRVIISDSNYSSVTHKRQMMLRNEYRKLRGSSKMDDYSLVCDIIEKNWDRIDTPVSISKNIDIKDISQYIKAVKVHPQAKDHYVDLVAEVCRR